MTTFVEDVAHRAVFHQSAAIHYAYVVGKLGNHRNVVGHQYHADVHISVYLFKQVEYVTLRDYVQCRRRLVQNDKVRLQQQGKRNHYTLFHAARQLVRIGAKHTLGIQFDVIQQLFAVLQLLFFVAGHTVRRHGFEKLLFHRHYGIKCALRRLKYHRHPLPTKFFQLFFCKFVYKYFRSVVFDKYDVPIGNTSRFGNAPYYGRGQCCLSAAAFAHKGSYLATFDRQRYVGYRTQSVLFERVIDGYVAKFHNIFRHNPSVTALSSADSSFRPIRWQGSA